MAGKLAPQIVVERMPSPNFTRPFWGKLANLPHKVAVFFYERPMWSRALLGLCLLSFFVTGLRISRSEPTTGILPFLSSSRSDFDDYFQASRAFAKGKEDPYRTQNLGEAARLFRQSKHDPAKLVLAIAQLRGVGSYLYPPFTAFLLTPLSALEYKKAALVFQVISFSSFFFFLYILYYSFLGFFKALLYPQERQQNRNATPSKLALLSIFWATIFLFAFLSGNAANGNIGFFLIFLSGLGLIVGLHYRFSYSFFGGFLLGLAVVMKVTPFFLVLLFLAAKRPFALLGLLFGSFFAFFVPGLYYGLAENWGYLSDWYSLIIENYNNTIFIRSWLNNQSLAGAIGRFFLPGQEVKQAFYGLPWGVFSEIQGIKRVVFFGSVVKLLSFLLYFLVGASAMLLALRGGFRAWIESFLPLRKKEGLEAQESFGWQRILLEPSMLRLHLLVVLSLLLTSGVSWYHAYSLLFFVLLLYFYKISIDKSVSHLIEMQKEKIAGRPWERPFCSSKLQLSRIELGIFMLLFCFGFVFPAFPKGVREFLSVFSVFSVALYVLSLALGVFLLKGLWVDFWQVEDPKENIGEGGGVGAL